MFQTLLHIVFAERRATATNLEAHVLVVRRQESSCRKKLKGQNTMHKLVLARLVFVGKKINKLLNVQPLD